MRTEDLIITLASEARPVTPLRSPAARATVWAAASIGALALGVMIRAPRGDFLAALQRPFYLAEGLVTLAVALAAAATALTLCVPGAERTRLVRWAPVLAAGVWVGLMAATLVGQGAPVAAFAREPVIYECVTRTVTFGLVPAVLLFAMVRRAAPLERRWNAGLAALGAFALGALGTQIDCAIDRPAHLLLWHMAPVGLLVAGATAVGIWVFRSVSAAPQEV